MPRLRDLFLTLRKVGTWRFLKSIYREINEDNLFVWASALAYSWLFAIFPFLIFLVSLLPYLPIDHAYVIQQLDGGLKQLFAGEEASAAVRDTVAQVITQPKGFITITTIVLALWAASGGMAATMGALNQCYDLPLWRPFYTQRPLAVGITLIVATLLVIVLTLVPIGTVVTNTLLYSEFVEKYQWLRAFRDQVSGPIVWTWNIARHFVGFICMSACISVIYYFGPKVRQKFRVLTPGSVFTISVWILLGIGFQYYVRVAAFDKTYGSAGGIVILLLIFYIDALVLLIGAQIDTEILFAYHGYPRGTMDFKSPPPKPGAS